MITDVKRLSGLQKVAILFTILGEGLSITLLKERHRSGRRRRPRPEPRLRRAARPILQ